MTKRIFTFLVAFLATVGNAVWGQDAITIDISNIAQDNFGTKPGSGYTAKHGNIASEGNTVEISSTGNYTIKGGSNNAQITVKENVKATITLATGLHVDASLDNSLSASSGTVYPNRCALEIQNGAEVTLIWNGDCELSSGGMRAGINVKPNATLILKGGTTGTLRAGSWNNSGTSNTYGAGIGGDSVEPNFGTIIIESGTVVGYSSPCGDKCTNKP